MGIPLGPINLDDLSLDVYHSLPKKLPRWQRWVCRILGEKKITTEKGVRLTIYHWRSKRYLKCIEYLGDR